MESECPCPNCKHDPELFYRVLRGLKDAKGLQLQALSLGHRYTAQLSQDSCTRRLRSGQLQLATVFPELSKLSVRGLSAPLLRQVAALRGLAELEVHDVTSEECAQLSARQRADINRLIARELPALGRLHLQLRDCMCRDTWFLVPPGLRHLALSDARMDYADWRACAALPHLEQLTLSDLTVVRGASASLALGDAPFPALHTLTVKRGFDNLMYDFADDVATLFSAMGALRHVAVTMHEANDNAAAHLALLPCGLHTLRVDEYDKLDGDDEDLLEEDQPCHLSYITPDLLEMLAARFPDLRELTLTSFRYHEPGYGPQNCKIGDMHVLQLVQRLPRLEQLTLEGMVSITVGAAQMVMHRVKAHQQQQQQGGSAASAASTSAGAGATTTAAGGASPSSSSSAAHLVGANSGAASAANDASHWPDAATRPLALRSLTLRACPAIYTIASQEPFKSLFNCWQGTDACSVWIKDLEW